MKKVLITGSNGLLGQKLVSFLLSKEGYQPIASSIGPNRLVAKEVIYESLDITNGDAVRKVVEKHNPVAIINCAAMTNVDACETDHAACDSLNVAAVQNLLEACRSNNIHLVHLSTDFVFDGKEGPYTEEDAPNPVSYYGTSKLRSEKLILSSGLENWAIVRTILLYGVTENASRSNVVLWAKSALEGASPVRVVNDQFRAPTLAEDLAIACYQIVDRQAKGIFHVAGKDIMSVIELVQRVGKFFGLDTSKITRVSSAELNQPAQRPPRTGFVLTKAQQELDYTPRSFEDGLQVLAVQLSETA